MKSKRMIFVSKIKIMLMFLLMIFILASCNKNKELQVKFIDWDGVELKTEIVSPGKSATAPLKPDRKEGHHFLLSFYHLPFIRIYHIRQCQSNSLREVDIKFIICYN